MSRFNVIQSKLKSHDVFPGYKEQRESYSESVVTVIRCLRLVLEPSEISWVDKKGDTWYHIVALGLNSPKEFRVTLKKLGLYCRTKILPVYHRQLLGRWTCTFGTVDPSEDSTYAVSVLRRLVHVIVDATDANWNPSIKLTDCFCSAVASKESTGLSMYMTELRELLPELLNLEGATKVIDEGRCAEIDAWCSVMVSQSPPWPPMTRWYIPRLQSSNKEERYMFLAERDIAFEMYCAFEVKTPLRTVYAATGESMMTEESLIKFLCLAFQLWFNDQDVKNDRTADFKSSRIGFGINMNHVRYLSKLQTWYLRDAFKFMNIDKLGIGSGISFNGTFCCVMLRLYGSSWKQQVEVPHKMDSNFLSFVNEATSEGLQSVLYHGGLHICKLLFAKEKMGTLLTPLDTSLSMDTSGLAAMDKLHT
ncbi:hypothetical protein THRCLA_07721 [Thraustotheca clavata]|uniref:Uncharacterized protein n=1 Tax=Thraustotheca clavata TaxID=74557 RepID=A0A1V9ZC93_9STRA|nr:hypothetical protein THRCLA_07721 [Thraustotheca clavata]